MLINQPIYLTNFSAKLTERPNFSGNSITFNVEVLKQLIEKFKAFLSSSEAENVDAGVITDLTNLLNQLKEIASNASGSTVDIAGDNLQSLIDGLANLKLSFESTEGNESSVLNLDSLINLLVNLGKQGSNNNDQATTTTTTTGKLNFYSI